MYSLELAGVEAFDIFTRSGRFAGLVTQRPDGTHRLYWNSNASRGSQRRFPSRMAAVEFLHQRRVSKGLPTD